MLLSDEIYPVTPIEVESRPLEKALLRHMASYLFCFLLHAEPCTPLGMESGKILDSAITASSVFDQNFEPAYGRLNVYRGGCAWARAREEQVNTWIQVDLGDIISVTGVATQGRCTWPQWVTSFEVSYSTDGENWEFYKESGSIKVRLIFSLCQTIE